MKAKKELRNSCGHDGKEPPVSFDFGERVYKAAISCSISAIAFIDNRQRIVYANPSFLSIWGYQGVEEIKGRNAADFWVMNEAAGRIRRKLRENGGWIGELAACRRDGTLFAVQASATMIEGPDNSPDYMMISFLDISERVQARKKQQQLMKDLRERIKELAFLYKIINIPHLYNLSLEEMLQHIVTAIPQSMQWPGSAQARITVGGLVVHTPGYRSDCINVVSFPLQLSGMEGTLEAAYDCTEDSSQKKSFLKEERDLLQAASQEITRIIKQKQTEDELRRNREQLLNADKMASLGVLSAEIMHEIGNPNNFISINAGMLWKIWQNTLPILDAYYRENGNFSLGGLPYSGARTEVSKLIEGIKEGSDRIKEISLRLKQFRLSEESSAFSIFSLNDAIHKAMEFMRGVIELHACDLQMNLNDSDIRVFGSSRQIQQALINLVTNACEALSSENKVVTLSTSIEKELKTAVVTIEDKGCGIEPSDLQKITDPFFSTKREQGNTGLGLSISNDIVIQHGGKLSFVSTPCEGTLVRLALPLHLDQKGAGQ